MANLEVALQLAAIGCYVFPCNGAGKPEDLKRPCPGIGWRGVSTTDARTIRAFWHRFPTAMPGIDMDKSGLIALDCDCKHGPDGLGWVSSQIAVDGIPGSITPSGGRHLIFKNPHKFTNARGTLPGKDVADLDIRGSGGFIIGPGSEMADGRRYEPIGDLAQLVELPDIIADYLAHHHHAKAGADYEPLHFTVRAEPVSDYRRHAYGQTAMAELEKDLAGAPEGDRNNQANLIGFRAGQLVGGGCIAQREAYERLEAAALSWGISPRDKALGARGTIWRAILAGMGNPRGPTDTLPDVQIMLDQPEPKPEPEPPPPEPALPDWTHPQGLLGDIADWIMASSRRPNRPLAVASAVATLSALCGRWLYGPTGTALNVFIVCLAGTSVGKDRPLSAPSELLAAAAHPRLHTSAKAFSVSAFEQMMVDHPCCVATVDEIGTNLLARMSHKKASTHEAGIRPAILELWSREDGKGPFSTTRHARMKGVTVPATIDIPRPNLTLFGVSTHLAFYEALTGNSVGDGFLNRFLLCEAAPRGAAQEVSQEARAVPIELARRLRAIPPRCEPLGVFSRLQDFERVVWRMMWASDAVREAAAAFEEEILQRMDANPVIAPLLGRVFEYAIRLASLHAVSRGGPRAYVNMDDLEWGKAWSAQSARDVIKGASRYMADGDAQAMAKAVQRVLDGKGWMTRRNLLSALAGKYRGRDLNDMLGLMIEAGTLEAEPIPASLRGGRPGVRYRLLEKVMWQNQQT